MKAEELAKKLKDPIWRINNLYEIKLTSGDVIPYKPKLFQKKLHERVYLNKEKRFLIPKSRRQGCSTCIGIMMADMAIFNSGWKLAIVDRTLQDATDKLTSIVRVALDSAVKKLEGLLSVKYYKQKIVISFLGQPESEILGGKYFRGSGLSFAHISELGTIATSEPKRAQEIINATIPAAKDGFIFIETTVRGGKKGVFYDNVKSAMETPEENKGPKDFRVIFLPWWKDDDNQDDSDEPLLDRTEEYFTTLFAKNGIEVSEERKRWWQKTKRQLGFSMNEEYPSTLEEAFEVPMAGSILEAVINQSMIDGNFKEIPYDGSKPAYATWDLGNPENTVTLVFQMKGDIINVLDVFNGASKSEKPAERVARLRGKYPSLITNYFPHDGGYLTDTGMTQAQMWQDAGLSGIQVLSKSKDKWVGINYLISIFELLRFDLKGTEKALPFWLSYRYKVDELNEGVTKNEVIHDASSHWTDPLRYIAEARMLGVLGGKSDDSSKLGITKSFGKYFSDRNVDRFSSLENRWGGRGHRGYSERLKF